MSEIATLELLEPHLAHVILSDKPASTVVAQVSQPPVSTRPVMPNGRQGSHLELFFSDVCYSTFVSKKQPRGKSVITASASRSGNSAAPALKYNLKLH